MPAAPVAIPTGMTGYLAPEGFVADLVAELGQVDAIHERLVLAAGPPRPAAWAANVWHDPVRIAFESINSAANALRAIQRSWALYDYQWHRRAALIADKLPPLRSGSLAFPAPLPRQPLGSWTLLDAYTLLASARCSSPLPNGEFNFIANHHEPPSRAYLKLWEVFTRVGVQPQAGERCVDLGAAPGGWTWVLANLGTAVLAVDKAPLADELLGRPNISYRAESAFALGPQEVGPVDWLFSDVICYPSRLLTYIERWLAAEHVPNFVCTLKFQGETDHATARAFAAIPGSQVLHLHHNKHELTWVRLRPAAT